VTATSNRRYITPAETERLLAAYPNGEWRLLVGLARLAGLRTPSETNLLCWSDVDYAAARLRVRSPKTERFAGHEQRFVPIVPRLMTLLEEWFELAPEGQEYLVTISSPSGRRRKMVSLMDKAGVERWDDTWQTLRRSCGARARSSGPKPSLSTR
jgi:integrase